MRLYPAFAVAAVVLTTTGCHSPYVAATVSNRTSQPILLLEVDYPSASFGTENLAPGAELHYRFKVLGSGSLKLLYTDSSHADHTASGPSLREGAEGPLAIAITPGGVTWQASPTVAAGK
jgi:hypothetical protein